MNALWQILSSGDEACPRHEHYDWSNAGRRPADAVVLQYTLSGALWVDMPGADRMETFSVPPGCALLFNYDEASRYYLPAERDGIYRALWLCLRGAGLAEHWRQMRARCQHVLGPDEDGSLLHASRRLITAASPHSAADPLQAAQHIHGWVMELMTRSERGGGGSHHDRPVDRAVQLLVGNPIYPWSLKEVATEAGCTREHLTRVFVQRMGTSPAAWLNDQRLRHARSLLRDTTLSVETIARQCGFNAAHTLARLLKQDCGLSPVAYRQRGEG